MISLNDLIQTDHSYVYLFLRIIAGIIVFPYGMQKLLGWFGGRGVRGTLADFRDRRIPATIGLLTIIGQSFGSIALLVGFLGRVAAGGLLIIFAGAMVNHLKGGWMMNWYGQKKGEGIEYFVMLLAILLIILLKGSGPFSIDFCIQS